MSRSRNRRRKERFQQQKREIRRETKKQKQTVTPITQAKSADKSKTSGYSGYTGARGARTRWCDHWQVPFNLGNGHVIFASAWSDRPMRKEDEYLVSMVPDIGFYLDSYWGGQALLCSPGLNLPDLNDSKTKVILFPWPDRGAPVATLRRFKATCEWLVAQIDAGAMVETGCFAAHGRTGTLLACLLVLKGMEANESIRQVRREHCDQSIETWEQIDFIKRFDTFVNRRDHNRVAQNLSGGKTIFSERDTSDVDGMTCMIDGEMHTWSESRGWMSASDIERAAAATMAKYDPDTGFASSLDTTGMTPATKSMYGLDDPARAIDLSEEDYERWLRENTVQMSDYLGGGSTDDALREHAGYVAQKWGDAYRTVTEDSQQLFQACCPWCGSTNVDYIRADDFVCNQCDQMFTDRYAQRGV